MKEHPRSSACRLAKCEVALDFAKSIHKHASSLTPVEKIRLIEEVAYEYVMSITRYMLRLERHNDPDKPADLE